MLDNTNPTIQPINKPNVGSATTDIATLTAGHSYTWYLGAVSTNGTALAWSSQSFTVAASPTLAAPTQIGPNGALAAGLNFDTPTYSWNSAAGAATYYLYVLDNTSNKPVVNSPNLNATSLISPPLTPGHSFTWYIGAETNSGLNGPIAWSTETFALAALTAPTPFTPIGAGQTTSPTFAWSAVVGANHYYLYLFDTTMNQVVASVTNSNISLTTFGASGLTSGHSYTWYVAAVSDSGADFWSGPASFSVT